MNKYYYSLCQAILSVAAIFSLMGIGSVFADNTKNDQTASYTATSPSTIVSVWTKGVIPPHMNDFIQNEDVLHAPYIPHKGWYDITKTFNGKDDLLCGAATAGNMIHWWIDQNKPQIENYLKKYPEKQQIMFKNEKMFDLREVINTKDSQTDNALFSYFKDKAFQNLSSRRLGVMPDHVIDMFINGYRIGIGNTSKTNIVKGTTDPDTRDLRGGLFDHVFHRGVQEELLTERHDLTNKTLSEISQLIKQELSEGKALAISHTYANVRINHVINLWGADINAEGNIEAIYVTDSDARSSIGMKKYAIGVNTSGKVAISAKKIEGDNVGARVLNLFTLSTGQKIWEREPLTNE
ncbi:IdeS/Mac family cysteine endopeptidase [Streptococcus pyogenes]|uniref:IdeS/Mac family cysteine endopeptidase n=1 Tax=Streptococcus pyogenes TaxID=1314 RepID=UPI00109BCD95|nr:IdeS/Mac family cysteine endopeptidase [Streptococcus pyogenes]QCK32867.1 IgG-degrading enzyme/Mac-1 IdeZ [Streptococcus pyogenes]VGQ26625.1 IgG endopeptidase [Streptococcus pyogenes]VGQ46711.1 IgG endopeptidase [Streptococcus pyogenes]VGQ72291.1 IgG endopeptidase [Streptococcus pyogenes]VGQ88388.1 IgG endopeptidase [Streptococcus pyogenes]